MPQIEKNTEKTNQLLWIGRINGPKGQLLTDLMKAVFPLLLKDFVHLELKILGSEYHLFSAEGKKAFEDLKNQFAARVHFVDFVPDVQPFIQKARLVIGAGRVAIETLLAQKPLYAVGEAAEIGLIDEKNLEKALESNFGDIPIDPSETFYRINAQKSYQNLKTILEKENILAEDWTEKLKYFDIDWVQKNIEQIYSAALMEKIHSKNIPILMYHKIPDRVLESPHKIFVTSENFEKHLRFFKFLGFKTITFKDYLEFAQGGKNAKDFPKKPLILTFDDGYKDNYRNGLPLMEKYGFRGVLYLLGDFECKKNHWDAHEDPAGIDLMSEKEKKIFVEKGWEIGAHTMTHPHLDQITLEQAKIEIENSKKQLEERLQTKIISFAYPYGDYDEKIKEIVAENFPLAVATDRGKIGIWEANWEIFRVAIFPQESYFQLFKKTSSWYGKYFQNKKRIKKDKKSYL